LLILLYIFILTKLEGKKNFFFPEVVGVKNGAGRVKNGAGRQKTRRTRQKWRRAAVGGRKWRRTAEKWRRAAEIASDAAATLRAPTAREIFFFFLQNILTF
jgi:hypothetical protein